MHIRKAVIVLLILTLLASFDVESTTLDAQTAKSFDDGWPMFHHDPAHTGTTTDSAPTSSPVEAWSFEAGNLLGDPLVVGDTVYIATAANMWALNAFSGETIWAAPTDHSDGGDRLVVEDGVIYSSNYRAYNASTGTQLWNTTNARPGPLAVFDGYLFGQDKDAFVVCLNASTGREIWKSQSYSTSSYPAIANGRIFFGTGSGLEALDAKNGSKIWEHNTFSTISGSPTVYADYIYAGNQDGFFYCINASSGKIVWSYIAGLRIFSSPAVAYGHVYFGSQDGNVYALNASSGEKLWNYTAFYSEYFYRGVRSSPTLANGVVYVCSDDGNLHALNAYTGDKLWNYTLQSALDRFGNPQYIDSSPVVAHGKIYSSSLEGLIVLESNGSKTNYPSQVFLPPSASVVVTLLVVLFLIITTIVVCFALRRKKAR